MKPSRRLVSALAILAVVWTALWPLVSSVRAVASSEPIPLCHQAGMEVGAGEAPMQDEAGAPANRPKTHCPLCIMAFYVVFIAPPQAPPFQFSTLVVRTPDRGKTFLSRFEYRLPQSRAPPALPAA